MTLAIVANSLNAPSETFIRAHVRDIAPGQTVVLCQDGTGAENLDVPILSDIRGAPTPRHFGDRIRQLQNQIFRPFLDPSLRGAQERTVREFLQLHGVTVVLAEFGQNGSRMRLACKRAKIPLYVHFHGSDASKLPRKRRWRRAYRKLFRDATGIIAPSKFLADRLESIGCDRSKLHVSPCGIDLPKIIERKDRPSLLLAVGRLVEKKSPLSTLRAFAKVAERRKELRLEVVGDGPLMEACRNAVDRLEMARCARFHGALPHDRVFALMNDALAFVQHSVEAKNGDCEGLPVGILEAMGKGLPVVSTRHSGIPEAVIHGETGLLVEEHDIDGMAEAMLFVVDNPEKAKEMGRAGRARVEAYFTHEHTAARLRGIMGIS
jgi:glycosyltransferase involved in cell wall biosynthesis